MMILSKKYIKTAVLSASIPALILSVFWWIASPDSSKVKESLEYLSRVSKDDMLIVSRSPYQPVPEKAVEFKSAQERLSSLAFDGANSTFGYYLNLNEGRPLTVFLDLDCIACSIYYAKLHDYKFRFNVRFVPASLGSQSARDLAVTLLGAQQPQTLLDLHLFAMLKGQKAILPSTDPLVLNKGVYGLTINDNILNKHGITTLPFAVYSPKEGQFIGLKGVLTEQDVLKILGDPFYKVNIQKPPQIKK